MRVLILGGDGYLGWPTALYFSRNGHDVAVIDNMAKRGWEASIGVRPLLRIETLRHRLACWEDVSGLKIPLFVCDIADDSNFLRHIISEFRPDAIIHYAEQPSAPYSMIDQRKAVMTQVNNVVGTLNVIFAIRDICPDAHLIKLGTMGEYGTPNVDIEEGWLELTHNGRQDRVLYPKKPGSLYHLSKVHDSANLEFACRVWGLRVTDLNQGVVYGVETDEIAGNMDLCTSFHYDAVFGTVINRFIVQAVLEIPLSVYGEGGQTRGFLDIRDTLACVELTALNPAQPGEFRVFNQFTEQFSIQQLADHVSSRARARGLPGEIEHIANPRVEEEQHYYNAKHSALVDLGLTPHLMSDAVIDQMLDVVGRFKARIQTDRIAPDHSWVPRPAIDC